jgi:hypothetical protein
LCGFNFRRSVANFHGYSSALVCLAIASFREVVVRCQPREHLTFAALQVKQQAETGGERCFASVAHRADVFCHAATPVSASKRTT